MSHQHLQKLLSAFFDGELTSDEKKQVREHLTACSECKQMLAELQWMRSDVRSIADVELSTNFATSLLRTLRQRQEQYAAWGGVDLFARRLVLALTIVVFLIVSVGSLNNPEQPLVMEPYLSGESADSTAQTVLTKGDVSKEDLLLAVSTR